MESSAKQKFKEILGMFKRLQDEICNTIESYYIWRKLVFSRSIVIVGEKKARKNAELMGLHQHFFVLTEQNHLQAFIFGINKFFEGLSALIRKIKKHEKLFTPEVLLEIYPDRPFNKEEVLKKYKPITKRDISEIEHWKERSKDVLGRLKTIRDEQLAHIVFKSSVKNTTFKPVEIEKLIEAIEGIFNKLYHRFGRATTYYKLLKEDAERSTKLLLENLYRGEEQRILEIKKKWGKA